MSKPEEKKKKVQMAGELPPVPVPLNELKTPKQHDLSHQRDERCVPLAQELIKLLAGMDNMVVGSHINESKTPTNEAYLPVVRDFLKLLIEKDVQVLDTTYIFALARQAIQFVQDSIDETLNQNMNRVTELVYDLPENKSDLVTIGQLNKVVNNKDKIKEVWSKILDNKEEKSDN